MDQTVLVLTEDRIPAESRRGVVAALNLLRESWQIANRTGDEQWTFAIELSYLLAAGSTVNALRWLAKEGWVEHKVETTRPGPKRRRFRTGGWLSFGERSCFVLTDKGLTFALSLAPQDVASLGESQGGVEQRHGTVGSAIRKPLWEPGPGRLWAGDRLLHQFPRRAKTLRLFLAACQEDDWEEWIESPFPPSLKDNAQRRLRDAVDRLNHCQRPQLLRFHVRDSGDAASWEWIDLSKGAREDERSAYNSVRTPSKLRPNCG